MASIKEKVSKNGDVSFEITVSCGYTEAGKKILKTRTFRPESKSPKKARKEAETYAILFEKQVKDGTAFTDGDHISFKDFIDRWDREWLQIRVQTGDMVERTREEHLGALRRYAETSIGHMKMSKIRAVHIDSIVNDMIKAGRSPKTIANVYHVINSIFAYAVRKSIILESPCLRAEPIPKVTRSGKLHTFTQQETNRFLNDALNMSVPHEHKATKRRTSSGEIDIAGYTEHRPVSLTFRTFYTLAVFTGARRGELAALKWSDIDVIAGTISITRAATSSKGSGVTTKTPKTAAGTRVVNVPSSCLTLLSQLKDEQQSTCDSMGDKWTGKRDDEFDDNYVFTDPYGNMMHPDTFTSKFRDILIAYNKTVDEDLQLPMIRLHDLRHSAASHLVSAGLDIESVAQRLGHARASFTIDTYTHPFKSKDREASDILDNLFAVAL